MTKPARFTQADIGLGPATEARIIEAFASSCLITAKAAAALLGLDPDTLSALTDAGIIRAVRPGAYRRYTEADIRLYLSEGSDAPCRSTSPRKAASGSTISSGKVVDFTALPASKLAARRKR